MNCANHTEVSALAFCRTCGKPLCATCTRDVRGVIYCENCLAAHVQGTLPALGAAAAQPGAAPGAVTYVPVPSGGPNPALAGILAGIFPFGVGAVYTSQYAKGLAHLIIFAFLASAHNFVNSGAAHAFLGIGLGFFYVYQIIDAVRSARALQIGQAPPDPFGLAESFGSGEKLNTAKIPVGAVVLIGLGVLFLLHTLGAFEFGLDRYWPLILIVIGGWLFARRWGLLGPTCAACDCERCRTRGLFWPAMMVTVGVLVLLHNLSDRATLERTWPVILLAIGGIKLWQSNASTDGHRTGLPGAGPLPPPPPSPEQASVQAPTGGDNV